MTYASAATPIPGVAPIKWAEPAKKKDNPFGPDILHNLLNQTEEAALGMLTAPWYIGKSVFADVKNVFDGSPGDFATDDLIRDIAKTTWKDIKRRWTPLAEGDFKQFWHEVETDPLGFGLDVATLATGGAGAAAKAGKSAAMAGEVTGLTKAAGLTKTKRSIDDIVIDIAKDRDKSIESLTESDWNTYRALARENISVERGIVDRDGMVWDGPTARLQVGNDFIDMPLSNNPLIRSRQTASIKFGNKYQNAPVFGGAKRGARINKRLDRRLMDREYHQATARAEQATSGLNGKELAGLSMLNWREAGVAREAVRGMYARHLARAEDDAAKAWEKADKDSFKEKAARAADLRIAQIKERLTAIDDDSIWELADPANMTDNMRVAAEELANVSKETTRQLWEHAERTTRNGVPIDFEDFWALQRSREARRIKRGDDIDELDLIGDEDSSIHAADLAAEWKDLKYSFVRPHVQPKEFARYGRSAMESTRGGVKAGTMNRQRRNNFVAFDDAMDVFDPRVVLEGARQAAQYNSTLRRVDMLNNAGAHFASHAEVPDGWTILSQNGTLGRQLSDLERWLDEDAVVVFGREQTLQETAGVVKKFKASVDDGIFAAPAPVANESLAEFKKANVFINKFDDTTNVWRKLTLTARPVWITGNLIGQMTLLLATHGFIKGGAAYMQAVRMGSKGALLDKVAPDVVGAGLVRDALQELGRNSGQSVQSVAARKALGQKGATARHAGMQAWSAMDKITQFNAWLTDDIPRRAAFLAEIKPHVRRIQNETGMSFEQAALEWLDSNPKVVDDLAVKVTADLVDFRSLTEFEKKYLRRLMPFWSWIRGATGRVWRMALDEPWKVWAGVNAAQWGIEQNEEQFGDLPDFLVGMLPVGEAGEGQQRMIASQSINPFATFGDIAGMLKSATIGDVQAGGSNPASAMNPFLKSVIETFTNRDLFYGTPLSYGKPEENQPGLQASDVVPPGYVGRLGERLVSNFPQQRLIEKLTQTGDQGNPTLYEPSQLDTLLSYFALPTKQLNVKEANERARAQKEGAQYGVI